MSRDASGMPPLPSTSARGSTSSASLAAPGEASTPLLARSSPPSRRETRGLRPALAALAALIASVGIARAAFPGSSSSFSDVVSHATARHRLSSRRISPAPGGGGEDGEVVIAFQSRGFYNYRATVRLFEQAFPDKTLVLVHAGDAAQAARDPSHPRVRLAPPEAYPAVDFVVEGPNVHRHVDGDAACGFVTGERVAITLGEQRRRQQCQVVATRRVSPRLPVQTRDVLSQIISRVLVCFESSERLESVKHVEVLLNQAREPERFQVVHGTCGEAAWCQNTGVLAAWSRYQPRIAPQRRSVQRDLVRGSRLLRNLGVCRAQ